MGIKGLSTRLRPHSYPFSLHKHETTSLDDSRPGESFATCSPAEAVASQPFKSVTHLIIDGPALAYYVHYRLIANTRAALFLLDELESYGLLVDSIFFDGYLPDAKEMIRHERLQQGITTLRAFRSTYDTLEIRNQQQRRTFKNFEEIFSIRNGPSTSTLLPPLSFLVPAIIETLQQNSRYRAVTKVVPGEADVFCKTRSEEVSCRAILTNDSDLIILHPHCKIIFLNDLEPIPQKRVLYGLYYDPCSIAKKLKCPDLVKLGYFAAQDQRLALRECAARARAHGTLEDSESYRSYSKAYSIEKCRAPKLESLLDSQLSSLLESLDPRISECVLRCVTAASNGEVILKMHLPPLVDDPQRASAWRISGSIRRHAYLILQTIRPELEIRIKEMDRRGITVVLSEVTPRVVGEESPSLTDLASSLSDLENATDVQTWILISVYQVLALIRNDGSTLPPFQDVCSAIRGNIDCYSWSTLHFQAQLEGLLYSLRILAQISRIFLALNSFHHTQVGCETSSPKAPRGGSLELDMSLVRSVRDILGNLPAINDLHRQPGESYGVTTTIRDLGDFLAEFYSPSDVDLLKLQGSYAKDGCQKQRRKKARKARTPKETKSTTPRTSNMYDLLNEA